MNRRQAKKEIKKELRKIGINLPWFFDEEPRQVKIKIKLFKLAMGKVIDTAIIYGYFSEECEEAQKDAEEALRKLAFGRYDKLFEQENNTK